MGLECKACSVYPHITESQCKIRHLRQDLVCLYNGYIVHQVISTPQPWLVGNSFCLSCCCLDVSLQILALCRSGAQDYTWLWSCCGNVVYWYPSRSSRRRPLAVMGFVEKAPEFGIFSPSLSDALVTEWCLKMQGSVMATQELLEEPGP